MRFRHLFIVCVLVVAGCAEGTGTTSTTGDPTTTAATTPTTTPAATSSTEATTTTAAGPRRFTAANFPAPFSIDHPEGWAMLTYAPESVDVQYVNKWGYFWADDRDSEEWLEYLTGHDELVATEPVATEVGGLPAVSLQVTVPEDAPDDFICGEPCVIVVGEWVAIGGIPMQIWLVDVDGQGVFIGLDAERPDLVDAWIAEFTEVLKTLVWE